MTNLMNNRFAVRQHPRVKTGDYEDLHPIKNLENLVKLGIDST
jgi:hypothetical protein